MIKGKVIIFIMVLLSIILSFSQESYSQNQLQKIESENLSKSQAVYVPVYSSIFHGDRKYEFDLAVTLSIRNINPKNAIVLTTVDYFDSKGKLIKNYLKGKRKINPLETISFIVDESNTEGGTGASFIVKWYADKKVNPPIVESIMIGTGGQQGISFTSRGIPINEIN